MQMLKTDDFFGEELIAEINEAIAVVQSLVIPYVERGEMIIQYKLGGDVNFRLAYHAALDSGAGISSATQKVVTMLSHPTVRCTGFLADFELQPGETNAYGSNRLYGLLYGDSLGGCKVQSSCVKPVEIIIAFSGNDDWQDELFVAAARHVLMKQDGIFVNDELSDDSVVGTARLIIKRAL